MMNSRSQWSYWSLSRTHAASLDPEQVEQAAKSFGPSVRQCASVTLIAQHDENGSLRTYLAVNSRTADDAATAAKTAAQCVDAVAVRLDEPLEMLSASVGILRQNTGGSGSRNNASGANPGDIARAFFDNSSEGDWVAITLTDIKKRSVSNYRTWVSLRGGSDSHFSASTGVVAGSIAVGSSDRASAGSLVSLVAGMLPGFDVETKVSFPGMGSFAIGSGVISVAAWAGLAFGASKPELAAGIGASLAGIAPASAAGILPTPASRLHSKLASGKFPTPSSATHASRAESVNTSTNKTIRARTRYPLGDTTFLFTPAMVIGLVAPTSESGSGAARTVSRAVPSALRSAFGPWIGSDEDGNKSHLDAAHMHEGVACVGVPGSGKSVCLRIIEGWTIAQKLAPSDHPDSPGRRNTIISFENKGREGAQHVLDYALALGDKPVVIDLSDSATPAIDMFNFPGTLFQRSVRFIEAMKYAFTDGSIGDRAIETMNAVFPAALLLHQHGHGSVMDIAHMLAGGKGDAVAVAAYTAVEQLASTGDREAHAVVESMGILFGVSTTPATRRGQCESTRNKLDQLRRIGAWWEPSRQKLSWAQLLNSHATIVINLGSSIDESRPDVSENQTSLMSSMLLFTLREAIMMNCDGWQRDRRYVSIFADELSLLTGTSSSIITTLRDKMRSNGVRCFFGTQYPNQLSAEVRETMGNFSTMMWFSSNSTTSIGYAVEDLSAAGNSWTNHDISTMPLHMMALRTRAADSRQSPCLVKVGYWENRLDQFASDQGIDMSEAVIPDRFFIQQVDLSKQPQPAMADASFDSEPPPDDGGSGAGRFDPHRFDR